MDSREEDIQMTNDDEGGHRNGLNHGGPGTEQNLKEWKPPGQSPQAQTEPQPQQETRHDLPKGEPHCAPEVGLLPDSPQAFHYGQGRGDQ